MLPPKQPLPCISAAVHTRWQRATALLLQKRDIDPLGTIDARAFSSQMGHLATGKMPKPKDK
jgi:hypothetical protein